MSATKKQSYKGLGLKDSEPKKRRIVLRDVSQEYEVEGEEPKGFRDVVSLAGPPPSAFLVRLRCLDTRHESEGSVPLAER